MKKVSLNILIVLALAGVSCQENASQNKKDEKSTVSLDTAHQGLEGTQDESAHLSTDVKADTSSGQLQHTDQNAKTDENKNAASTKDQDAVFISEEVGGNYAELEAAESGLKKSGSQEAKSIAGVLKKDHTTALGELKSMSSKMGIAIPSGSPSDLQAKMKDVDAKSGGAFDKAWCEMLIDKHKKTIDKYESVVKGTSDNDLKKWINKTLPHLRMHLDKLMSFHDKIKV